MPAGRACVALIATFVFISLRYIFRRAMRLVLEWELDAIDTLLGVRCSVRTRQLSLVCCRTPGLEATTTFKTERRRPIGPETGQPN
jgi:hypothetical protein